jgi:hypothetical protein
MNIVPHTKSLAQRHAAIGYALYVAGQPVTACQTNEQRRGWYNAYIGHMAATDDYANGETAAYLATNVANIGNRGW